MYSTITTLSAPAGSAPPVGTATHAPGASGTSAASPMKISPASGRIAGIASEAAVGAFTDAERTLVETVKAIIRERQKVGCTGCRYCMPCPQGVDIPATFHYYNLMYFEKKRPVRYEYARNVGMRSEAANAAQCVGCGKCEAHCPQKLPIRTLLKEADRDLRPLPYRAGVAVLRKALKRD